MSLTSHDKTLYVLEAEKFVHLDVTDVAEKIRAYQARYDLDTIVIDNANKQAVQELQRRHDLPLRPADKTGKSDFIEIMNGEFIQGRIKLDPARCAQLVDEYAGLIWDDRSAKREEHPNCPNHLTDATLYAWRFCYAYLSEILSSKPKPYTKEWYEEEEKEMEEAEVERYIALRRSARKPRSADMDGRAIGPNRSHGARSHAETFVASVAVLFSPDHGRAGPKPNG